MTVVSYVIGDFKTESYEEAVRVSEETNQKIVKVFTQYYGNSIDKVLNNQEEEK